MAKSDKRSALVFTLLKPVEHEALKKRARAHGASVSSTIRLLVLRELFQQANDRIAEQTPETVVR